MSSKKWVLVFLATVLVLAALLAALNLAADPFGAFGDRLLSWFSYDETRLTLTGEESGEVWGLGRRVAVEVVGVNVARGQIDLALVRHGGRPRGTSRRADMPAQ